MIRVVAWKVFYTLISLGRFVFANRGPRVWHFAYGANLSPDMWKKRKLTVFDHHDFVLEDYVLSFTHPSPYKDHGFADILPKDLSQVYGKLLHISVWDMWRLDALELVPFLKRHHKIWLTHHHQRIFAYRGHVVDRTVRPTQAYVDRMLHAYTDSGLHLLEHAQVLRQIPTIAQLCKDRRPFVFCQARINAPVYNHYLAIYDRAMGRLLARWYPHALTGE